MEKFNEDDGVWRTIRGRRVFIREGESVESAMSRSGKFSRVERNKDKYDKINKFRERKQSNIRDLKVKYHKTNTGVEVDEEDRKRIMKSLGYDDDKLEKNFDAKDNKYSMKDEERAKVFKELGLRDDNEEEPTPIRKDEEATKRREKLMRYTQENKDKIAQYGREYDEETNKQAFEKAQRGEGLKEKEYYGMIGSQERPGDIITDVTADGEDVIVAKDGQWVRKSRIQAYNDNPRANKDAIVDLAEEERKIDEREKINRFKEQKQSNIKQKDNQEEVRNALKSSYIYRDEKSTQPYLEEYKKKYGEKAVNDAFKYYDDNFVVAKGTQMDSEGLTYNSLLDKKEYSKEALDDYVKGIDKLRNEMQYSYNSKEYNKRADELLNKLKQSKVKVKEGSPIEELISKEGINVGGRLREIDNETISIFKALKDRNANDQMAKFILHSKYYDSNEDNLLDKYKDWLKKNK